MIIFHIIMPIYSLVLFARTLNVESIFAPSETTWSVTLSCSACSHQHPNLVQVNRQ